MTLRACVRRSLMKGGVWALVIVAALVVANGLTVSDQQGMPAGVSECWNQHTAQIFTVVGECPVYAR